MSTYFRTKTKQQSGRFLPAFCLRLLINLKKIDLLYKTLQSHCSCALPSVESLGYNA